MDKCFLNLYTLTVQWYTTRSIQSNSSAIEPNRTTILRLPNSIEHNWTHNKILPIEHNRMFDYRTPHRMIGNCLCCCCWNGAIFLCWEAFPFNSHSALTVIEIAFYLFLLCEHWHSCSMMFSSWLFNKSWQWLYSTCFTQLQLHWITCSLILFDYIGLIGSKIELTAKQVSDFVRLPNPIERLKFD